MGEIKPALSEAEWAKRDASRRTTWIYETGGVLTVREYYGPEHGDQIVSVIDDARFALAALALDGQPFGVTWKDVDAIYTAMALLQDLGIASPLLRMLADRIEALLPPRETP